MTNGRLPRLPLALAVLAAAACATDSPAEPPLDAATDTAHAAAMPALAGVADVIGDPLLRKLARGLDRTAAVAPLGVARDDVARHARAGDATEAAGALAAARGAADAYSKLHDLTADDRVALAVIELMLGASEQLLSRAATLTSPDPERAR